MVTEQQDTTAATVKGEAARQAVILAFGIVSVLVMVAAQRAAGDPDFYRSQRMKAAKASERMWEGSRRRSNRLNSAALAGSCEAYMSTTTSRPPGAQTRAISRSPSTVSVTFRSPKATETI